MSTLYAEHYDSSRHYNQYSIEENSLLLTDGKNWGMNGEWCMFLLLHHRWHAKRFEKINNNANAVTVDCH